MRDFEGKKIILAGHFGEGHVASYLANAARGLGIQVERCDYDSAFTGPFLWRKLNWKLADHRPSGITAFSEKVASACRRFRPDYVITMGIAYIERRALDEIGRMGIMRFNYSTDDPWSPSHKTRRFLEALPSYDHIFSTRRSNTDDFLKLGCKKVSYLPFGYAPEEHHPKASLSAGESALLGCDVVFAGFADTDRVRYIDLLARSGFKVGLYGLRWERFQSTRYLTRGRADADTMRSVISAAKVALCLVRRSNRDGNSMRTFEIPAIGACMLAEDTAEHREIFGDEGNAVRYFRQPLEMAEKLRSLLKNESERRRLAAEAHRIVINGKHSYGDRLISMFGG